jgi:hypothetical protein
VNLVRGVWCAPGGENVRYIGIFERDIDAEGLEPIDRIIKRLPT